MVLHNLVAGSSKKLTTECDIEQEGIKDVSLWGNWQLLLTFGFSQNRFIQAQDNRSLAEF
jgi:hypothetical protein